MVSTDPDDHPSLKPYSIPSAALVSDRFQVIRPLGSGGMATVYEVVERATGKHFALKRLHPGPDGKRQRRTLELFEREFYTLSQITHPRVVEVYDYGVDEQGAYYTMELLDGEELQRSAPLGYREVCRIGRDLGSVLSLLHSRRLVFRDLNPRNVYGTTHGYAKLLDFGAVAPMGPSRQIVGTPGYSAPEALEMQPLDARTDLYSLGATLYFALTGRHAYPYKTFEQLRSHRDVRPPRPSELNPEVPAALDALIMDLMYLDPALRPANAAEVMEQLAAIEGTKVEEQLQVTQAYLVTPTLVGREAALGRVRAKLLRAVRGFGSALVLSGSSGVGRSRLLGACMLEAKIMGTLVLSADASDASENYGVVRALASSLLEAAPELALRCAAPARALLGIAVPELLGQEPLERAKFADPNQERVQLMAALRDWFIAVADARPVTLAIDDLHRIDEPSASLLALCAHAAGKHALTVVVTREPEVVPTAPGALELFDGAAACIHVSALNAVQVGELLRSTFGAVPHVQALAEQLHAIAAGNPRDTLQLAQELVDRGVARYRSGAWSLPASLHDAELPADMAQALRRQIAALSGRARALGRLISLVRDRSVGLDDCVALDPELSKHQVSAALDELCRAHALKLTAEGYSIAHAGFHAALQQDLSDSERKRLHRVAAELFARRGGEEFRRALHLLEGGEPSQCLDVFVPYAERSRLLTNSAPDEYLKLVQSMPENWLALYTRAIALCEEHGRPASQQLTLRERLCGLLNVMRAPSAISRVQLLSLQATLSRASGLDDYLTLDAALPPDQRLKCALELARARYDKSPEHARTAPPELGAQRLIGAQISAIGMTAPAQDYGLWSSLVSLAPFIPLAPAADYVELFREGVGARIAGRHEHACRCYEAMVERGTPERTGLPLTPLRMVVYGVTAAQGMMEAAMGRSSTLRLADAIEDDALFRITSLVLRMLHELWQGRVREADELKERAELLRVQTSPRRMSEGIHLVAQVCAHAYSDDLTRMKHGLDEVRDLANRHEGWIPVLQYASGEYQRIRGDLVQAAQLLEAALTGISAGTHQIWPHAAGALTRVLWLQGRVPDAIALGSRSLQAAEQAELGYLCNYIRMPLALALADTGETTSAVGMADLVIASFLTLKSQGLNLVLAYETRTRVAIRAADSGGFERYAELCAGACREAGSRVLRVKHERLVRTAINSQVHGAEVAPLLSTLTGTQLTSVLVGCDKPSARAERCLALLLKRSGASAGYLFLMGEHGPQLVAQTGPHDAPPALSMRVSEFVDTELQDLDLKTGSLELEQESATHANRGAIRDMGEEHRLVLLNHQQPEGFAITGAAALVVASGVDFVHPGSLAAHLSRLLFDAGDVTPVLGG